MLRRLDGDIFSESNKFPLSPYEPREKRGLFALWACLRTCLQQGFRECKNG